LQTNISFISNGCTGNIFIDDLTPSELGSFCSSMSKIHPRWGEIGPRAKSARPFSR